MPARVAVSMPAAAEALRKAAMLACAGVAAAALLPPAWCVLVVVAPWAEEAVFRAGVQESLVRRLSGLIVAAPLVANVLASLAFAAVHVAIRGQAAAWAVLLPALLIGAVYQQRRRIGACVALHAICNLSWLRAGGAP